MTSPHDWSIFRRSSMVDPDAAERGRLMTAQGMAEDSVGRQRMENHFGIEFCHKMYPEAYRSGFSKMLDKIRTAIPW